MADALLAGERRAEWHDIGHELGIGAARRRDRGAVGAGGVLVGVHERSHEAAVLLEAHRVEVARDLEGEALLVGDLVQALLQLVGGDAGGIADGELHGGLVALEDELVVADLGDAELGVGAVDAEALAVRLGVQDVLVHEAEEALQARARVLAVLGLRGEADGHAAALGVHHGVLAIGREAHHGRRLVLQVVTQVAETALLVAAEDDAHVAARREAQALERPEGVQARVDGALVVEDAAARDAAVFQVRAIGWHLPARRALGHDIQMAEGAHVAGKHRLAVGAGLALPGGVAHVAIDISGLEAQRAAELERLVERGAHVGAEGGAGGGFPLNALLPHDGADGLDHLVGDGVDLSEDALFELRFDSDMFLVLKAVCTAHDNSFTDGNRWMSTLWTEMIVDMFCRLRPFWGVAGRGHLEGPLSEAENVHFHLRPESGQAWPLLATSPKRPRGQDTRQRKLRVSQAPQVGVKEEGHRPSRHARRLNPEMRRLGKPLG